MVDLFDNVIFFSSLLIFVSALSLVFVYDYFFLSNSGTRRNFDDGIQNNPVKQKFKTKS